MVIVFWSGDMVPSLIMMPVDMLSIHVLTYFFVVLS